MTQLTTRAFKVTCTLNPKEVAALPDPATARVLLRITDGNRVVTADINSKSVRKAKAAIAEHAPDAAAIIVQGKLVGEAITEAGLVAQVKVKPQGVAEVVTP